MAEDRWISVALPILEAVSEREGRDFLDVGELADLLHLPPEVIAIELERLAEEGFLAKPLNKMMTGGDTRPWFVVPRLGERGARIVGAWPSDDLYEAMVDLLDRRIAESTDDGDRHRFEKLKAALKDVGAGTAAGLLVEVAKGLAGVRF